MGNPVYAVPVTSPAFIPSHSFQPDNLTNGSKGQSERSSCPACNPGSILHDGKKGSFFNIYIYNYFKIISVFDFSRYAVFFGEEFMGINILYSDCAFLRRL